MVSSSKRKKKTSSSPMTSRPPFAFVTVVLFVTTMMMMMVTSRCWCHASSTTTLSTTPSSPDELANDVVRWVISNGGYFSPKIEIRNMIPNDISSPLGVYATDDIAMKESLMEIPHTCFLDIRNEEGVMEVDDTDWDSIWYYNNLCLLSKKVRKEMDRVDNDDNDESRYAPYVRYLKAQRRGQLPATWSKGGKDLLRQVVPRGSDMVDWIDKRFKTKIGNNHHQCISPHEDDDSDDDVDAAEHAVALVVQRGYETTLIPLWDMVNHWNGRVNTENDPMYDGDRLRVRASRDIQRGEEIYASYDECVDCRDVAAYWGTPEILRDFGFVEGYQQRWVDYPHGIWFEIDTVDEGSSVPTVEWDIGSSPDDDQTYGVPKKTGLDYMRDELVRLETVQRDVLSDDHQGNVPDHEWKTTLQFHTAYMNALTMAIASAEKYWQQQQTQQSEEEEEESCNAAAEGGGGASGGGGESTTSQ